MPTSVDLMGLGTPGPLADLLATDPVNLTTTGTTQATAAPVLGEIVYLTTAGSQTGARIGTDAKIGVPYYFFCPTATTAIVYAPTGSNLNGAASTTGQNVAQNKMAVLIQFKRNEWASFVAA